MYSSVVVMRTVRQGDRVGMCQGHCGRRMDRGEGQVSFQMFVEQMLPAGDFIGRLLEGDRSLEELLEPFPFQIVPHQRVVFREHVA